ncbi:MAG: hypothetical protein ABH879_06415 [archaeon]
MVRLSLTREQFDNFLSRISEFGLKRIKDGSSFPLDFRMVYKSRFLLNFEYFEPTLEFYMIGLVQRGKKRLFRNAAEMQKYDPVLLSLKEGFRPKT